MAGIGNLLTWTIILTLVHNDVEGKCAIIHKETHIPTTSPRHARDTHSSAMTLIIPWRGRSLRMRLIPHVISPDGAVVEWHEGDNVTKIEAMNDDLTRFYQGYVVGANYSYIALERNNGFSGYIQLENEGIYVQLLSEGEDGRHGRHLLYSCGASSQPAHLDRPPHHRYRRQAPSEFTKYLEVLVVADSTVVNFVGKDKVKSYVMGLMNIVNTVYHDPSLGLSIEVVTVKIMFMDKAGERKVVQSQDPQNTVASFCRWVSSQTYRSYRSASGSNHDVAVLLTRSSFAPAGYAPITGMCVPGRSCALVKDDGFTSAFVIAHEIAHVFGLMHDGHGNECHGPQYASSLMATVVMSSFNNYWWSVCSKRKMSQIIDSLPCLNNNPYYFIEDNLKLPLGLSYSLDEQCRFEFGGRSTFCRSFGLPDPCAQLWCTDGQRRYQCKSKNVVPLEGTQCGPTAQWYCKNGACGYHGHQAPVHGGWSEWSHWSNCSALCEIGFKRRSRICDNPKPAFGGNACDGISENTDTCIAETCEQYVDLRAAQCGQMNMVEFQGRRLTWLPYQTHRVSEMCKLTCVSKETSDVVTFDVLVENGTPCKYGQLNEICMDGVCEKVGCDGVLGSDASTDVCGECEGDASTCKLVTGTYERTFKYSAAGKGHYETALVLPKGARNISITETATLPHFIAVQETYYYNQVLNGDGREGGSRNFVLDGAWFQYLNSGGHEKLTSTGPIRNDVKIQIYPQSHTVPASVNFSYVIDKTDFTLEKTKYKWKFHDWSPCSVSCGKGVQHIIYRCHDRDTDTTVPDDQCRHIDGYDVNNIECETMPCESLIYNWRMLKVFSECSASCGESGVHHRLFECERLSDMEAVGNEYCLHVPEPIEQHPCNRIACEDAQYSWQLTGQWSSCSRTCGQGGTRHQLVRCVRDVNKRDKVPVAESLCTDLTSPAETRSCNGLPCVSYRWQLTDKWLECNETCGEHGVQNRKYECIKFYNEDAISAVGVWYCADQDMQTDIRPCNRRTCATFTWRLTDDWTTCSVTCGQEGMRSRVVACVKVTYDDREMTAPDSQCDSDSRPAQMETCSLPPCSRQYTWRPTDDWSPCSVTCGEGKQTQGRQCIIEPDLVVEDGDCLRNDVPGSLTTRTCSAGPCGFLEWGAGSWSMCSRTCGQGQQKRQVYCGEPSTDILVSRCPGKPPAEYRPCEDEPCTAPEEKSCLGDRAPFCKRADSRFCSHAAYERVCCESCSNVKAVRSKRHRSKRMTSSSRRTRDLSV